MVKIATRRCAHGDRNGGGYSRGHRRSRRRSRKRSVSVKKRKIPCNGDVKRGGPWGRCL